MRAALETQGREEICRSEPYLPRARRPRGSGHCCPARLPVLRAGHFEDYENWEPDFRESRARRAPPHAASAPEQSRAGWTRGRLGNEFRIRGSWSR